MTDRTADKVFLKHRVHKLRERQVIIMQQGYVAEGEA